LILRSFAAGCSAVTGMEVISNGVKTFRRPESENASTTMIYMSLILAGLFMGITFLASHHGILPKPDETVVSQLARLTFGTGALYYALQIGTMLLLILAANSAFAGFPHLASILARDGYMPRQMASFGDRLVFSNGIIILGVFACFLLILFHGDPHALIPLYAVGVFISFTLSQTGMVRRWLSKKGPHWQTKLIVNGLGAITTGIATIILATTKFTHGAWIVNQAVIRAVDYARSRAGEVRAVIVDVDAESTARNQIQWAQWGCGVQLTVLPCPYRSVLSSFLDYVEDLLNKEPDTWVTVVIPEILPAHWWHGVLHNQRALLLKASLLFKERVILIDVPFHLKR
jgi:amino acid transporter